MILTTIAAPSHTLGENGYETRCLARRGMLYSDCEAVDHVRLGPGAELGPKGRTGAESAWFVLSGSGSAYDFPGGEEHPLTEGDVLLASAANPVTLRAAAEGLELLWLAVLPEAASNALPTRKPAIT